MRYLLLGLALAFSVAGCVDDVDPEVGPDGADGGDDFAETEQPLSVLCQTTPVFSSITYEVPTISGVPHAEFHQRGGLTYVAGKYLDVVFTIGGCPQLTGVSVDGVFIGTAPGPDGPSSYYQVISDQPVSGGHRVRVRLWLTNNGQGTRRAVQIWAASTLRDSARTIDIDWVGIHDISGETKVSVSAAELRSSMASGVYQQFGDDGWQRIEGATTGWHSFGYNNMSITIDDSIRFHASQKYRVFSLQGLHCDITATVDGRFRISRFDSDPSTAGNQWKLRTDWIKPSFNHPLPFQMQLTDNGCFAGLSFLVGGVVAVWENVFLDVVKDRIGSGIAGGITCGAPPGIDCAALIQRFEYASGELIAVLDGTLIDGNASGAGVTLTVLSPYRLRVPGNPAGALPLPAGSRVLITEEGLVTGCYSDTGSPSTCNSGSTAKFGGGGLFNWSNQLTWPVPNPLEFGYPAMPQREQALGAHAGLIRAPSQLPAVHHYPGALLGFIPGGLRFDVSRPCLINTPSGPPTVLELGRNDRNSNGTPYGTGTVKVQARFANLGLTCPSF